MSRLSREIGRDGRANMQKIALCSIAALISCTASAVVIGAAFESGHQTVVRDLLAEGSIDVGDLTIQSDEDTLTVTFSCSSGWVLEETNLEVAPSVEGLSADAVEWEDRGFEYGSVFEDGTPSAAFEVPLNGAHSDPIFIAAQAKVRGRDNHTVVSSVGDLVYGPVYDRYMPGDEQWGGAKEAVVAKNWIPIADNPILPGVVWGTYWWWWGGETVVDVPGATWISAAQDTEEWWLETWRWYPKTVTAGPNGGYANITLNADNICLIYLNGELVGEDPYLFGYPRDPYGTEPISHFKIDLQPGSNSLDFVVCNLASGIEDVLGYKIGNPNGLTYSMEVTGQCAMSAWGQGATLGPVEGGMYIEYCPHGHSEPNHGNEMTSVSSVLPSRKS